MMKGCLVTEIEAEAKRLPGAARAGAPAALAAGRRLALALMLLAGGSAVAQVVPPGVAPPAPVLPADPATAASLTTANPLRVYGDDAPVFSGLDVLSGLGLHLGAALTTEYNDNIARRSGNAPLNGRYNSRDDWAFRPSVNASIGHAIGRQQLYLSGVLGRDYYVHNTRLDRNRLALNGGVAWQLGVRCGGQLGGGYSKRGTQFGVFEEVVPSTQTRWSLLASGSCRTATGLSANLSYNRYTVRNHTEDPLGTIDRSFADVNSQMLSGGIGYPLGRRGEIGVQGQWRDQTYIHQLLPNGEQNGTRFYGANVFANYRLGPSLRLNGGVGRSWVRPKHGDSFVRTFSGTTWNLGLDYSGPRLGANVSIGRSANGSSGGYSNYSISRFLNTAVTYRANDRLGFSAGYSHDKLSYEGFGLLPETEVVRQSTMDQFFVGADYRVNRMFSASLDYRHRHRSSQPTAFSYSSNVVGLTLRAAF